MKRPTNALTLIVTCGMIFSEISFASEESSVTGQIKEVTRRGEGDKEETSILVEGCIFHIKKDAVIVFSNAHKGSRADLTVGKRVSVRRGHDIFDTFPTQEATDVIVIHVDAKVDEKKRR